MGCHTWTYKKVSALTGEEKQQFVDEEINSVENWWGFKNGLGELTKTVEKWYKEEPDLYANNGMSPEEYAKNMREEFTKRRERIKKEGFSYAIECYKPDISYITLKDVNGENYIQIGFDVPFRVYGYPEETFTNKEELLEFLKDRNVECYDKESNSFIKGYSEELVKRIEDYFNKHGESNLYFEFG